MFILLQKKSFASSVQTSSLPIEEIINVGLTCEHRLCSIRKLNLKGNNFAETEGENYIAFGELI